MSASHDKLGKAVREMRLQAGLNQKAICERSRVAPATVRKLEQGKLDPRWSTLVMLVKACGRKELVVEVPDGE